MWFICEYSMGKQQTSQQKDGAILLLVYHVCACVQISDRWKTCGWPFVAFFNCVAVVLLVGEERERSLLLCWVTKLEYCSMDI